MQLHNGGDTLGQPTKIELSLELQRGIDLETRLGQIALIKGSGHSMTATIGSGKILFQNLDGEWGETFDQSGEYQALRTEECDPNAAALLYDRWCGQRETGG